jgi:MoaA/NifB/PqqE/SkfB family radical SAM enzyme
LNCLFCSRQLSTRKLGYLSLELASAIFIEAGNFSGAAVRFTGWGEPLLHPEILELTQLAKQNGLKIKIYTNGLALTPKMMEGFVSMGLDELQFSLQGLNPLQYEANRRGASYSKLEKNIHLAAQIRGAAAQPFLSILTSVLADELDSGDPQAFTKKFLPYVDKVAIDFTNLNFVKAAPQVLPHLKRQSGELHRGKCVDVFLALEIKYDGTIQFCGQDANNLSSHSVGTFGEISLHEAWKSSKMEAQRNLVGRALGHAESPVCRDCYHNTTKYDLFKKALHQKSLN